MNNEEMLRTRKLYLIFLEWVNLTKFACSWADPLKWNEWSNTFIMYNMNIVIIIIITVSLYNISTKTENNCKYLQPKKKENKKDEEENWSPSQLCVIKESFFCMRSFFVVVVFAGCVCVCVQKAKAKIMIMYLFSSECYLAV